MRLLMLQPICKVKVKCAIPKEESRRDLDYEPVGG